MEFPEMRGSYGANADDDLVASLFASVREAVGEEATQKRSLLLHQKISNASHLVDATTSSRHGGHNSHRPAAAGHAALEGETSHDCGIYSGDSLTLNVTTGSAFGLDEADQALLKAVMGSATGGEKRGNHGTSRILQGAIQVKR